MLGELEECHGIVDSVTQWVTNFTERHVVLFRFPLGVDKNVAAFGFGQGDAAADHGQHRFRNHRDFVQVCQFEYPIRRQVRVGAAEGEIEIQGFDLLGAGAQGIVALQHMPILALIVGQIPGDPPHARFVQAIRQVRQSVQAPVPFTAVVQHGGVIVATGLQLGGGLAQQSAGLAVFQAAIAFGGTLEGGGAAAP